jgi:small subunit ribosomal protein S26e
LPKKRKSRGRAKGAKGRDTLLSCDGCGRLIPRGKAIKVTKEQSFLDPQLEAELEKKGARIIKAPVTVVYCVSCAIFRGIRKVRAEEERDKEKRLFF